jgi:hypothetical protein
VARFLSSLLLAGAVVTLAGCYQPIVDHGVLRPSALDAVLARTERARGIHADRPVAVHVVSAAELGGKVRAAMLVPWQDDELARYQESLVTVGLWPPERDLVDEMTATLGAEAVGLYVPEDRALYVVSDPAVPLRVRLVSAIARRDLVREYALAHELVHFLQHDAYPKLFADIVAIKDDDDAVWAAQAAIEGDAVRYGCAALQAAARAPSPVDFHAQLEQAVAGGPMSREPGLIREGILFPYGYGYRLSIMEATDLLERPPASTEQALHLDKRRDAFTVLRLPGPHSLPAGCEVVWGNSVGELGLSILFRDLSPSPDPRVWEGWDGDRYVAARCNGIRELAWLTSWDSESDAEEFASGYRAVARAAAARAQLQAVPQVQTRGTDAVVFTPRLERFAHDALAHAERQRVRTFDDVIAARPAGETGLTRSSAGR